MERCHLSIVLKYPLGKAANRTLPLSMAYQLSEANYYFWKDRSVFLSSNKQISDTRLHVSSEVNHTLQPRQREDVPLAVRARTMSSR